MKTKLYRQTLKHMNYFINKGREFTMARKSRYKAMKKQRAHKMCWFIYIFAALFPITVTNDFTEYFSRPSWKRISRWRQRNSYYKNITLVFENGCDGLIYLKNKQIYSSISFFPTSSKSYSKYRVIQQKIIIHILPFINTSLD